MNSEQRELWSTIRSFDIDGGPASLTFSKRLARENGWSVGYAERVVDEYRKFVFLCMASGHKCTPSDEVDQAWHLHMIYTESYWTRFCGEVLPRSLTMSPNTLHDVYGPYSTSPWRGEISDSASQAQLFCGKLINHVLESLSLLS